MSELGKKLEWIYKLRGEDVTSAMRELKRIERSDAQTVAAYKEKKLEDLLQFVRNECRFYKNVASRDRAGQPRASAFDALREFPVVDKATIKSDQSAFTSPRFRASLRSTSGTTGTPFVFWKDKHASAYMDAMMYCAYEWHGIGPLTRQARIWGSAINLKGKVAQKGKDFLLGRKRLSAFEISDANCRKYFYELLRHKPEYFYCYPNAMHQFVLSLERQGLDGREIGATVVICTGEVLFPHQKEKIEQITGCKVINEYGSTENGIIAFECEYGSMHILPTVHVDILNQDSEGYGEVAVTELNSLSVPFINYKIGDRGRILRKECDCEKPYETIEISEGRIDNFIVCPDGNLVYDAILAYVLKEYAEQFKAYQDDKCRLRINMLAKLKINNEDIKQIEKKLKKYLGSDISIEIEVVNEIALDKSGKLSYFISKLDR